MLPTIRKVIRHIEATPYSKLSIEEIARSVGLSSSRISRLFKSEMGMTLGRYIKRGRLERARELLGTTNLTVKETLFEVGLSDPSHFGRDFRRAYGLSPAQYRKLSSSNWIGVEDRNESIDRPDQP